MVQPGALSASMQAALVVWGVLLRFMGDLPEPALFARNSVRGSSAMRQIHGALGGRSGTRAPHGSAEVPGARVGGGGTDSFRGCPGPRPMEMGPEAGGKTQSECHPLTPAQAMAPGDFQS